MKTIKNLIPNHQSYKLSTQTQKMLHKGFFILLHCFNQTRLSLTSLGFPKGLLNPRMWKRSVWMCCMCTHRANVGTVLKWQWFQILIETCKGGEGTVYRWGDHPAQHWEVLWAHCSTDSLCCPLNTSLPIARMHTHKSEPSDFAYRCKFHFTANTFYWILRVLHLDCAL